MDQSVLYGLVKEHIDRFLDENILPAFIGATFRRFQECGIPEFGCFHLKCAFCGHDEFVAFSCKLRGICFSCSARAAADSGLRLVEGVLPQVPFRHWVVSYPFEVGQKLAFQPKLISAVETLVHKILRAWQEKRGNGKTGGMLFRHRFGSNLYPQMHNHLLMMLGVFHLEEDGSLVFVAAPEIQQAELDELAQVLWKRIAGLMRRRGIILEGQKPPKNKDGEMDRPLSGLAARHNGLHLFASATIPADDRAGLEQLCRYLLRATFDADRLRKLPNGSYAYRLLRKDHDGNRDLVMTPNELLMRLSSLIPTARIPTRRYFGILAGGSEDRSKVVPKPTHRKESKADAAARGEPMRAVQRATPWAELMRRLWDIDVFKCPNCPFHMVIRKVLESPAQFAVYCHLSGLARGPPASSLPA